MHLVGPSVVGLYRIVHPRTVLPQVFAMIDDHIGNDARTSFAEVFNMEQKEIPSRAIGEIVMDKMKNLDPVAYVRFASVYREFKDVK